MDAGDFNGLSIGGAARILGRHLTAAGVPDAALDARLLTAAAAGLSREDMVLRAGEAITAEAALTLNEFGRRRGAGEPVSRILGRREFWGMSFGLNAATLDPRPDSETLIETALAIAAYENWREREVRVLDLGTGTGCLLLALLSELPRATGLGIDISGEAANMARANAMALGLDGRVRFAVNNWLEGIGGVFDLIVSNPPYIAAADIAGLAKEVKDHDPVLALDGGDTGFTAYEAIVPRLPACLAEEGWVVFETGAGQAGRVAGLLANAGLTAPAEFALPRHDLGGVERVVAGKRQR